MTNVRVRCSTKAQFGIAPYQYTIITGIGGFVCNGEETRIWFEPEAMAIAYIKTKTYCFYMMTDGLRSNVVVLDVGGVERLRTNNDSPSLNRLARLRACAAPLHCEVPVLALDDGGQLLAELSS